MSWGLTFYFNSILLGVGLAMDAFSVSVANGLTEPGMRPRKRRVIAGTFGWFQFFMPMAGWVCIHAIATQFELFQKAVPWIALVLLLFIGGKMLIEGVRGKGDDAPEALRLSGLSLLVQGIATSIDALSVGFALSSMGWLQAGVSAAIIGIVTYFISMAGLRLGKKASGAVAGKAGILGGCILIFIGLEIFIRGLL